MNSPYIGIYKCGNDSGLQFIQIGLLYEIVTERTELVWQELHTKILSFQGGGGGNQIQVNRHHWY